MGKGGKGTLDCASSLLIARASRPFCTPSRAGSTIWGDVEASRFRKLLLPRLFEVDPSLDTELALDELLDPELVLRSPI